MRRVRVAAIDEALRDAVEGNDDLLGRVRPRRHRLTNRLGERLDIGRMGVVRRDDPECRHDPQHRQLPEHLVVGRSRRGAGVLRVQREEQQPVRPPVHQLLHGRPDRRIAVAHAQRDLEPSRLLFLEGGFERARLRSRDDEQRRAVARPDPTIERGRAARSTRQDEQPQDEPPEHPVALDDAGVAQKLPEVSAKRRRGRRIRRAELREQHADPAITLSRACVHVSHGSHSNSLDVQDPTPNLQLPRPNSTPTVTIRQTFPIIAGVFLPDAAGVSSRRPQAKEPDRPVCSRRTMRAVTVVGGGFSGLATAYYLSSAGVPVEIVEKTDRLGGLIATLQTPHGPVETAAIGMRNSARVDAVCRDLGLPMLCSTRSSSRARYIYRQRPRRWPLNPGESLALVARFATATVRGSRLPRPLETVEQWGARVLGRRATRWLLGPTLQGMIRRRPCVA